MMKKSLYNYFGFSCYRYAPESFHLTFQGKIIDLDDETRRNMGYVLLTQGQEKLLTEIKKWTRRNSNLREKPSKRIFALACKNGHYIHIGQYVNRFDIQETLWAYKNLKETLEHNHYQSPITVTKATLDGNFNAINHETITEKIELANRTVFV